MTTWTSFSPELLVGYRSPGAGWNRSRRQSGRPAGLGSTGDRTRPSRRTSAACVAARANQTLDPHLTARRSTLADRPVPRSARTLRMGAGAEKPGLKHSAAVLPAGASWRNATQF